MENYERYAADHLLNAVNTQTEKYRKNKKNWFNESCLRMAIKRKASLNNIFSALFIFLIVLK